MGTNYYAVTKLSKADKKLLKEAISSDNLVLVMDFVAHRRIHIGKSSLGCQFCFDFNKGIYYKDKPSLISFLDRCKIYDEYDREISIEEFWEMVENKKGGEAHLGSEFFMIEDLRFSNTTGFS